MPPPMSRYRIQCARWGKLGRYTPQHLANATPGKPLQLHIVRWQVIQHKEPVQATCFFQGNSAYVRKQYVDPDRAHTLTAIQRDSPQTVTADGGGMAYMVPGNTNTNPSSLDGEGCSDFSHTARTSLVILQWLTQNFEVAAVGEI
jgi:hypothetical protein